MAGNNLNRKMRFLPYFPYGCSSKLATIIEGRTNPYATMLLLGEEADDILAQSEQHRKNQRDKAKYLCDKGYAKNTRWVCGTPAQKRSFRQLTKNGLAVLTEAPDETVREEITEPDNDGKIKETHFRSTSLSSTTLREQLSEYATSTYAQDRQAFEDLLFESVIEGKVTPLSYSIDQVEDTTISTRKYSQNQLYTIWRLSHISAMFLANSFLTYLDRRPHDTGFAIDGIVDRESYDAYRSKHGNTIASFTYNALTNWYNNHPGFYQITQQYPDESQEAKDAWLETPAFYYAKELPEAEDISTSYGRDNALGNQQRFHSTHIGLATGKKCNYICYHGKKGPLKWIPKREAEAKREVEQAVRHMKTQNPDMKCRDSVDFGLYFCSSYHQFLALFDRTIERHKKNLSRNYLTDAPYTSLHAIPVNDSGTFLLWCLLQFSPMETENSICNSLVAQDEAFAHQMHRYYPLTYKGKRVFLGYTMDISKINLALEDHLDGQDFYICCFPEQASWYRKLFPGHTIL